MIVVTTDFVPGKKIVKTLGIAKGNTIRARHIGHDKMMAESREQAIDRMVEDARQMGANAVVNVRFTTSMIMQMASEILVYGTAVIVE